MQLQFLSLWHLGINYCNVNSFLQDFFQNLICNGFCLQGYQTLRARVFCFMLWLLAACNRQTHCSSLLFSSRMRRATTHPLHLNAFGLLDPYWWSFRQESAFAKRGACKRGLRKGDIGHHQLHSNYIPETWSTHNCHWQQCLFSQNIKEQKKTDLSVHHAWTHMSHNLVRTSLFYTSTLCRTPEEVCRHPFGPRNS